MRRAQSSWSETSFAERKRFLAAVRRLLVRHTDDLAKDLTQGLHANRAEALSSEVLPLLDACRFLEKRAGKILAPRRPAGSRPFWLGRVDLVVRREPWGVVLIIGPSNYPLLIPGVQVLQALAAGNAVLVKPGQGGRPVIERLRGILRQAGLDDNLVRVLGEAPEDAERALARGVDKVLLTGSSVTGRTVLRNAAETLTPATVELSGCDAVFVVEGADLDRVASALAFGLRLNGSATCIAPRRVFVPASRAAELEAALKRAWRDPALPVVNPSVLARLEPAVNQALERGSRLVIGSTPIERGATGPWILADVPAEGQITTSDLFCPVLSLVPVREGEDPLRLAAASPYALGASVFGDEAACQELARRIRAGCVVINDVIAPTADPRLPFGGRGESGFGVTRGEEGLLEMTTVKAVSTRRGRFLPHLMEPRPEQDETLFRGVIAMLHGAGLWSRIRAAIGLGPVLWKRNKDES